MIFSQNGIIDVSKVDIQNVMVEGYEAKVKIDC
jgi:hypothetical protein